MVESPPLPCRAQHSESLGQHSESLERGVFPRLALRQSPVAGPTLWPSGPPALIDVTSLMSPDR